METHDQSQDSPTWFPDGQSGTDAGFICHHFVSLHPVISLPTLHIRLSRADIVAPFGAAEQMDSVSHHAYSLTKTCGVNMERCFYTLGRVWCAGANWAASTDRDTQISFSLSDPKLLIHCVCYRIMSTLTSVAAL